MRKRWHHSKETKRKISESRKGEKNVNWKGNHASILAGHMRAIRGFKINICSLCKKPAIDRHHKDNNVFNNISGNVQGLCRKCHMIVDGRMGRRGIDGKFMSKM